MLDDQLACANGTYSLVRPGANPKQGLRAWDAADEYLIHLVNQHHCNTNLLVLNDQFGALGCALHKQVITWASDSLCAKQALEINLKRNQIDFNAEQYGALNIISSAEMAIMKIAKNSSFLAFQLNQCLQLGIKTILLAGMMKHLPKTLLEQLQRVGEVKRLPFVKKATVFELQLKNNIKSPYPKHHNFAGVSLLSHANVFGRDKLDPGAAFLMDNMSALPSAEKVADLCCGSGILGIKYAQLNTQSQVDFYDESLMAVESSRASWQLNHENPRADFIWEDGLGNTPKRYDLILCNPPFHETHTVGDHIAKRLFKQSKAALQDNGRLVVVGNRHLQYHVTLKKYFKCIEQISAHSKFVLLIAHG